MTARRKSKQKRARRQADRPQQARPAAAAAKPARDKPERAKPERAKPQAQAAAPPPQPQPLSRIDLRWAGGVAALSAILFATTLNGHPGLGDAPESVAGVAELGVLHAPGYPAYVLAAWIFTLLVPVGSFALQVNLFSLVCASLSIAGVYLLARRCGAARWASALGALALAVGAGFWLYSGFAKHDMFSGLLFVAGLNLLLAWQAQPSRARLVGLAAIIGLGLGSSWPLMVLLLPAVGLTLLLGRRRLPLASLGLALTTGVLVVVAIYGFLMMRASQDPALNWGEATSLSRLFSLVNRADFTAQSSGAENEVEPQPSGRGGEGAAEQGGGGGATSPPGAGSLRSPSEAFDGLAVDFQIFYHELGLTALILAGWGLFVSLSSRRGPPSWVLLTVFVTNLVGGTFVVGVASYEGFDTLLVHEGFLLGCYFVLAAWIAIGATDLAQAAAEAGSPHDRRRWRSQVAWGAAVVLGLAVLVPSLISHDDVVQRNDEPFADRYAKQVFEELPDRSVVVIFGAERTQPLVYRQVVHDEREDVEVIAADGLSADWYREQLARRLGRSIPPRADTFQDDVIGVIESLRGVRPVFMDMPTAQIVGGGIAYRPDGLLARAEPGSGPQVDSPLRFDGTVQEAELAAGMPAADWQVWPSSYVLSSYTAAGLEVARAYLEADDLAGLRRALLNVLRVDPENSIARENLATLEGGEPTGG